MTGLDWMTDRVASLLPRMSAAANCTQSSWIECNHYGSCGYKGLPQLLCTQCGSVAGCYSTGGCCSTIGP